FQAEDGIRDRNVTGVQTCALPICRTAILDHIELKSTDLVYIKVVDNLPYHRSAVSELFTQLDEHYNGKAKMVIINYDDGLNKYQIGRASCRERVSLSVVAGGIERT